ncbi:hypothetical protein [Noviluteimonas gilva]|uniref:Uncharacterized protein n=1 Tax=Noviluteimonas gilva TaxID=2682097 RepID=A0A7C9LNW4_9GAMM|nr:hypothetical protein [Lysobacter gilvus]MUV14603.1 hypothetical protein [Lysobacter gilvus]
MIGKLKWTAIILVAVAVLLGTRSLDMLWTSGHFGSPIAHTCRRLSATAPHDNSYQAQIPKHCDILMKHVRRMVAANDNAALVMLGASGVLFAWGAALLIWVRLYKRRASAKPMKDS